MLCLGKTWKAHAQSFALLLGESAELETFIQSSVSRGQVASQVNEPLKKLITMVTGCGFFPR